MTTRRDFPGAPQGSYVSEEGWLIVGDEAWTAHEWSTRPGGVGLGLGTGRPIAYDDERHRRQREQKRLYYARKRAAA